MLPTMIPILGRSIAVAYLVPLEADTTGPGTPWSGPTPSVRAQRLERLRTRISATRMMMMRANQMTIELFDAGAGAGVVMVSASGAAMVSAGITAPGSAADVCAAALGAEPALAVAL